MHSCPVQTFSQDVHLRHWTVRVSDRSSYGSGYSNSDSDSSNIQGWLDVAEEPGATLEREAAELRRNAEAVGDREKMSDWLKHVGWPDYLQVKDLTRLSTLSQTPPGAAARKAIRDELLLAEMAMPDMVMASICGSGSAA